MPYYVTTHLPAIQKQHSCTQGKLRLNLHALSVSVSELLEYTGVNLFRICVLFFFLKEKLTIDTYMLLYCHGW